MSFTDYPMIALVKDDVINLKHALPQSNHQNISVTPSSSEITISLATLLQHDLCNESFPII